MSSDVRISRWRMSNRRVGITFKREGIATRFYTVSQKRELRNFCHNFNKCWPIFKMFSLLNLELNLQQTDYILATIAETCRYYTLRNQEMLILVLYKHNKCNFNTTTRQIYLFKLLGTMATIFQVYQTKLQNIDKLKQQLIHVWYNLEQSAIDNAITLLTKCCLRLRACVHSKGHILDILCNWSGKQTENRYSIW